MENQQVVPTTSSNTCEGEQVVREEDNIIDSMDNDATILRQRRVAFYNNWNNESQGSITKLSFILQLLGISLIRNKLHFVC